MNTGWQCPNCGKAHAPHVQTCPEPAKAAPPLPWDFVGYPPVFYDPPPWTGDPPPWRPSVTCGSYSPPNDHQWVLINTGEPQEPLGADFSKVWDDNTDRLYEA